MRLFSTNRSCHSHGARKASGILFLKTTIAILSFLLTSTAFASVENFQTQLVDAQTNYASEQAMTETTYRTKVIATTNPADKEAASVVYFSNLEKIKLNYESQVAKVLSAYKKNQIKDRE